MFFFLCCFALYFFFLLHCFFFCLSFTAVRSQKVNANLLLPRKKLLNINIVLLFWSLILSKLYHNSVTYTHTDTSPAAFDSSCRLCRADFCSVQQNPVWSPEDLYGSTYTTTDVNLNNTTDRLNFADSYFSEWASFMEYWYKFRSEYYQHTRVSAVLCQHFFFFAFSTYSVLVFSCCFCFDWDES